MTPLGRLILAALANAFMKRWNDRSKACGSSMRNTRLKVSWLGSPCFSVKIGVNRYALVRANSAMSVQCVAPHSVANRAMNSTSLRSCSAFSARGSGRSEKQAAKLFIDGSFRHRSHLLNPFLLLEQQLIHPNMRFTWSYG